MSMSSKNQSNHHDIKRSSDPLIEANQPVYPLSIVRQMRDQRAMLIQTASQYKFVCEAVLKVFNDGIVKPMEDYQR